MNLGVDHLPLGELAEVITKGTTPKTLGFGYASAGIPFLRAENIRDLTVTPSEDMLFIDDKTDEALSRSRVLPNDVLISIAGTIGRVGVVPETLPRSNCNQAVAIVRPGSRLIPRYLAHWLACGDAQRQIAKAQVTATISNLSLGQIAKLRVPLLSLTGQRHIADILDKAEAIQRKRKEAIDVTGELLRSTFLEMFGDPVLNSKNWPVQSLGELADIASGVTKGKRYDTQKLVTLPYMRVANVQDCHLSLDEVKTITVSEEDGVRYRLKSGDVLLTEGGDPDKLGRGTVWRDEIPNCIHQNHVFRVRLTKDLIAEYLSALIGSERGKRYFLRAAKQTTGIATINISQLRAFPVLVPPHSLQASYVTVLSQVDRIRAKHGQATQLAASLFEVLVHQAFRGAMAEAAADQHHDVDEERS